MPGEHPAGQPGNPFQGSRGIQQGSAEPALMREQARVDFLAFVRPLQKTDRALAIGLNKALRKPVDAEQAEALDLFPGSPEGLHAGQTHTEPNTGFPIRGMVQGIGPSPHFLAEA